MKIVVLNGGRKKDRGQADCCGLLALEIFSQRYSVETIDRVSGYFP